MLKLMYITSNSDVARIVENAGVDRIFIDMEYIGKDIRQGGMDTVQNHCTVEDVRRIRKVISKAQLMVRVNPIHDAAREYDSSEKEIEAVIAAGADLIMLPYFQTAKELERFIKIVDGRARVFPLLESKKALENIDEILEVPGIDEIHIGLNDLSLELKKKFMFELLADGTVEMLCEKFRKKGIPYGYGGIGRLGKGDLPAEYIIKEHYRLGSTCAILSRSFCNTNIITELDQIKKIFEVGLKEIRNLEKECMEAQNYFEENKRMVQEKIKEIAGIR
ncbi:aldolase/citrate lyase family protein [[Clostridium] polysaccharolyticum]|uniref:HpcH/HpaI aldolase/citrate lyase family protein n=1 Tax=[Clostridium] polysaccharolyticum TaxID=29364 RepID=A0A1H9ZDI1_9FIRM|nr:aldolase/citrate lyase family protein [[Clostridium] polysaccharolyticum]SES78903.1 HpcH/HpaI aldolase/citrate lyase family protein [[Clostridium] polysaccharolyticum]